MVTPRLPVLAQLWPNSPRKWLYLAEVAVLTRLATGVMRVLENSPGKQKDPRISEGQKKQAMAERAFVELAGTTGYMICLHLGQDLVDKAANLCLREKNMAPFNLKDLQSGSQGKQISQEMEKAWKTLDKLKITVQQLDEQLRDSFNEIYGHGDATQVKENALFKTLYEHDRAPIGSKEANFGRSNLGEVKNSLLKKCEARLLDPEVLKLNHGIQPEIQKAELDTALKTIINEVKPLKDFARRNNRLAIFGVLTGVATSALVGGTMTQWMNDRVIAPSAKKFFTKKEVGKAKAKMMTPLATTTPAPSRPLSLMSAAPGLPAPKPLPPVSPAYLPNPKMQASGAAFAGQVFRPYQFAPKPTLGGPFS